MIQHARPLKGSADDGKRLGLSESAMDVAWPLFSEKGRGSGGGGALGFGFAGGLADDGKRLGLSESALDVAFSIRYFKWGGGLGEGCAKVHHRNPPWRILGSAIGGLKKEPQKGTLSRTRKSEILPLFTTL